MNAAYAKMPVKLKNGEIRCGITCQSFVYRKNTSNRPGSLGVRVDFCGRKTFLIKVSFSDGKSLYEWVFQKGESTMMSHSERYSRYHITLRPPSEQSFGLDQNNLY